MTAAGRDGSGDPSTGAGGDTGARRSAPPPGSVEDEASLLVAALQRRAAEMSDAAGRSPQPGEPDLPPESAFPRDTWVTGLPPVLRSVAEVADLCAEGLRALADALETPGPPAGAEDGTADPTPGPAEGAPADSPPPEANCDDGCEGSLVRSDSDGGKERA